LLGSNFLDSVEAVVVSAFAYHITAPAIAYLVDITAPLVPFLTSMAKGPLAAVTAAAAGAVDGSAVVAVLGVRGSRPAALADAAVGTGLAAASGSLLAAEQTSGDASAFVMLHSQLGEDGRDAACGDAATLAVSLAGVVVLNARAADFERGAGAAGVRSLMHAIKKNLELRVATAASAIPARRLLVVAVRDYDPEVVPEAELEAAILGMLQATYGELEQLPAAYTATELKDLFDIQVHYLASETLCAEEFEAAAASFGRTVADAGRNGYADAGLTAEGLEQSANRVWEGLDPNASAGGAGKKELPTERELAATFACTEIMKAVFARYTATTRQWKATVESGRIIRDFGKESSNLINATLDKYSGDATSYRTTKAFARKMDELRALCLADAYTLYAKQILKLREVAYQVFRGKLARIRINDRVEKMVNTVVKEAEGYFVEKAESLRSTLSNWRFDNERHELVNHMREDATERLQLARLQGNYVPPIRAPVAVAFHTLLTAPFGQDAAAAQAAAAAGEPPSYKVDKDKVKKADLARSRPHQTSGRTVKISSKDEVNPAEFVNMFSGIFMSPEEIKAMKGDK
jgi:hypothetical protein